MRHVQGLHTMREPLSSIALVLKNGTQITSKSPETKADLEKAYLDARESKGDLRIEDGSSDMDTIILIVASDVAVFSVANYIMSDKEKMEREARNNGVIKMPPQKIITRG